MTKLIRLRGKHAVGAHTHTIVDDALFDELNQHAWKAKPNGGGSHVYAVRVQKRPDGRSSDLRMHRVILGYDGPLDIDHINRNALDNRAANLRVVTRSVNVRNTFTKQTVVSCKQCSNIVVVEQRGGAPAKLFCSEDCKIRGRNDKNKLKRDELNASKPARIVTCGHCGAAFPHNGHQKYCGQSCKSKAKWQKWKTDGSFPLSVLQRTKRQQSTALHP